MNCCGIDLGGTALSAGIYRGDNTLLCSGTLPTCPEEGESAVLDRITALANRLAASTEGGWPAIRSVGLAIPGLTGGEKGPVVFAPNVCWEDTDPVTPLEAALGRPVYLFHDAACAAVAESRFGHGRAYQSFLFLTLGTAIGGAFLWNGKLFSQHGPFGSELGHIPLRGDGIPCSCGLPGCFQQYGSANALARQTAEAAHLHPESAIWALCGGREEAITSHTAFQGARLGDPVALQVLARFTGYLAEGIAGLVNIFRPDAVVLGGGLSNAGDMLLRPTQEKLVQVTHAARHIGVPPLLRAKLGDGAGALGAALLAAQAEART